MSHPAPQPRRRYGVIIEIPEAVITEIGEDNAWAYARGRAAAKVLPYADPATLAPEEHDYPQEFPVIDPETGRELPPMRAYRFTYRPTNDA